MAVSFIDRRRDWNTFRAFNLYRLTLGIILLVVFFIEDPIRLFGKSNPSLFLWTAATYLFIIFISLLTSFWRRPPLWLQAHLQTLVDLIGLSLLIHASGGINSNLSILLVLAVATSSILLPLYSALLAAALAFFFMLTEWLYSAWTLYASPSVAPTASDIIEQLLLYVNSHYNELGRLGILGASAFITALLTHTLAERTRSSEALVRRRSQELLVCRRTESSHCSAPTIGYYCGRSPCSYPTDERYRS